MVDNKDNQSELLDLPYELDPAEIGGSSDNGDSDNGETSAMGEEEPSVLKSLMASYFMEYASYVIKDRAIPDVNDGLKPVQRRILHSLWEMDDGKFHKVANVVGNTMKFHPHGDASIGSALVNLANKDYFIEKQGNFGNIFTGDIASAARYIECRLSPLAREVLFNKEITEFEGSYDGRNQEPVSFPAKVPVLLMQGTEGIAVGMATRVLPHNFPELLKAQIAILRNKSYQIFPDFYQGGIMDVGRYQKGNGKIRLRAKIEPVDQKTLVIREIPATTTTESLMNSIEDAATKGKLKIATLNDYTAESVEIEITLPRGIYADQTIKALYAYTTCEVSISTNCLVIRNNCPWLMNVNDVLEYNTHKLVEDLKQELEIELGKLQEQFHAKTLAQIFIENRIYKRIEECESYEDVVNEVQRGLEPYRSKLNRDVTGDDIEKLLQIPIRRISQFDIDKNKRELSEILAKIDEVQDHLSDVRKFTVEYLKQLLKKYRRNYPRKTTIENLETVDVREIALSNVKVGWDRSTGYVGTAVRCDEPITCTEYDRIVIVNWDGTYKVITIPEKLYIGSVCSVMKSDKNHVYSMIYRDKKSRISYAKRFRIDKYIMDRQYRLTPAGCKVDRLFDRYGIVVRCEFSPTKFQRVDHCEVDFEDIAIRTAAARGLKIANKKIIKYLQVKRGSEIQPEESE
jgi:topoisomerase IV subunit A